MANLSEKAEGALVGVGSAATAISAYAATSALPLEVKSAVVAVSGAVGVGALAFWYGFVNKKPQPAPQQSA